MKNLLRTFALAAALTLGIASHIHAADLSITAASFQPGTAGNTTKYETFIAGATITAGQLVTISPSTGKAVLADADDATLYKVAGIAAGGAASGQPLAVVTSSDDMTLGATLSMVAPVYCLSSTAGGICPTADIGTGEYPVVVLIAYSTTKCIFRANGIRGTAPAVSAEAWLSAPGSSRLAFIRMDRSSQAFRREESDLALAA